MSKIIGVTEARSKLKDILDEIAKDKEEAFILARGSKPEAVIISYEEYVSTQEKTRELWDRRFISALERSRLIFRKWLRKHNYDPDKLTEEEILRIIQGA